MVESPKTTISPRVELCDGTIAAATLAYYPDYERRLSCVDLNVPELGRFEAREHDYFECLVSLRTQLASAGARLLCWGARKDVWVSGMQRDMGAGLTAYRLPDAVDGPLEMRSIFSDAEPETIATVEEQQQFAMAWCQRRRNRRR